MKIGKITILIVVLTLLVGVVCLAGHSTTVLWFDDDMKTIPEPKERKSGYYDAFFKGQVIEGLKEDLDLPRWVRRAAGHPKQASNVNALDEVPDSSWYTNRHHIRRMSAADLKRGPNTGKGPDFTTAVIAKAKPSGVTPGLMLKDANGESYLVKFDSVNYPNLQSGAEMISTKILYAAGYNVPENYIAYIHPDNLKIGEGVEITDSKTGKLRALTRDDIDQMMWRVARTPDGRCRVLASKVIKGKLKGPFPQVGLRLDDPNDLIPHEHRRELRGLRVIASWINDWDLKEAQSIDAYVEENGRKFLRHYLLDFGSSLGADDDPTVYFHGHEYGLDLRSMAKEVFSLGAYESPNERAARIISPEIGNFTADDFNPGSWKPTFPSVMFDNLTDLDAFWASRVILSFNKDDLQSIIQTAEYSNPMTSDYMLRTLLERQQIVARYWLGRGDALSDFSIRRTAEGAAIRFHDLLTDHGLTRGDTTKYTYQVERNHYKSAKNTIKASEILIDRETLGAFAERGTWDAPVQITIWTHRGDFTSEPVRIYFDWTSNADALTMRRIARG